MIRYNPCTPIRCFNSSTESAICQTRIDSKTEYIVGEQRRAYFDPSFFYAINIVYPFIDGPSQKMFYSNVHVICDRIEGRFVYDQYSESSNSGPQSANFTLYTRYACPYPLETTSTRPPSPPTSSWISFLISALCVGIFCCCSACCALCCMRTSPPPDFDDPAVIDSERTLQAIRLSIQTARAARRSRDYYSSSEAAGHMAAEVETSSGPEVHSASPHTSRSGASHGLLQRIGDQSSAVPGLSAPAAPETLAPPTYETVIRMKELETREAGAYVVTPAASATQQNRL